MKLLLDGKAVRNGVSARLKEHISKSEDRPCLVILQIGNLEESNAYIGQKKKFGEAVGAQVFHKKYPEYVSQAEVIADIEALNNDQKAHGIILQLPIPASLNAGEIIEHINPAKDVDGLTATNFKLLAQNNPKGFVPATTKGVLALLKQYQIELKGKKVLMIGRSMLVGKPTAIALLNEHATVTIAHSKTADLKKETLAADIIIVAIGKARYIGADYVRAGQVIVDVGINLDSVGLKEEISGKRKLVGDVDFDAVKDIVDAISPVPGGVGAMTVASLFENLVEAWERTKK
jgi:5,10-methylene-tetrahydrofolate dehydrogenase/methenyl tetrahydrofolate cyclohydrolase